MLSPDLFCCCCLLYHLLIIAGLGVIKDLSARMDAVTGGSLQHHRAIL